MNGNSFGKKNAGASVSFVTEYEIPYENGELRVIAYKNGQKDSEWTLKSGKGEISLVVRESVEHYKDDIRYFEVSAEYENGVIAERTRTRWGRFRPWILWMSPVLGISLVLTFFVWPGNMVVKAVLAGVGYILFGMAYTAAGIPMQSLPIVMTRDMSKRVKLYSAFGIAS